MPTLTDLSAAPNVRCRFLDTRDGTYPGFRCTERPATHGDCPVCHRGPHVVHEYASLWTPCLHCPAAISWSAGEWRDSRGGTQGHVPDPSFL